MKNVLPIKEAQEDLKIIICNLWYLSFNEPEKFLCTRWINKKWKKTNNPENKLSAGHQSQVKLRHSELKANG